MELDRLVLPLRCSKQMTMKRQEDFLRQPVLRVYLNRAHGDGKAGCGHRELHLPGGECLIRW